MIAMAELLDALHRFEGGHAGGRREFWVQEYEQVGRFISEEHLKPVPVEHLHVPVPVAEALETRALRPRPFPGGMVGPHLHHGGEVYLLEPEQWKKFSSAVLKQYRDKLEKAGTISFEGLMELGAGIARL